jgi:hypothetical protein
VPSRVSFPPLPFLHFKSARFCLNIQCLAFRNHQIIPLRCTFAIRNSPFHAAFFILVARTSEINLSRTMNKIFAILIAVLAFVALSQAAPSSAHLVVRQSIDVAGCNNAACTALSTAADKCDTDTDDSAEASMAQAKCICSIPNLIPNYQACISSCAALPQEAAQQGIQSLEMACKYLGVDNTGGNVATPTGTVKPTGSTSNIPVASPTGSTENSSIKSGSTIVKASLAMVVALVFALSV